MEESIEGSDLRVLIKSRNLIDPLYGIVNTSPCFQKAIKTQVLLRLKEIKQLSFVELLYHCANHTRFEHSIGVYYLTGKLMDSLRNDISRIHTILQIYFQNENCYHILKEFVQLLGLFHDIGQGPFSHQFYEFLSYEGFILHLPDLKEFLESHERFGANLFNTQKPFLNEVTEKSKNDLIDFIVNVQKTFLKFNLDEINKDEQLKNNSKLLTKLFSPEGFYYFLLGKELSNKTPDSKVFFKDLGLFCFIFDIISSIIDCDRLDFLNRDSYFTGFPNCVNIWVFIESAKIEEFESLTQIVFPHTIKTDYEIFLQSREFSYRKIYYHPYTRIAEQMLIRAFHFYFKTVSQGQNKEFFKKQLELMAFWQDREAFESMEASTCPICKNLILRLHTNNLYINYPLRLPMDLLTDWVDESGQRSSDLYYFVDGLCNLERKSWEKIKLQLMKQSLGESKDLTIFSIEEKLCSKLRSKFPNVLPDNETLILDFSSSPSNRIVAYQGKKFFYEHKKGKDDLVSIALLSPHLNLDETILQKRKIEMSSFLINFPLDIVRKICDEWPNDDLIDCSIKNNQSSRITRNETKVNELFIFIIETLFDILIDISKVKKDPEKMLKITEEVKKNCQIFYAVLCETVNLMIKGGPCRNILGIEES